MAEKRQRQSLQKLVTQALAQSPKSQRDIAETAGVSTRTIYQMKKGKREDEFPEKSWPADTVIRLAIALGEEDCLDEWLYAAHHDPDISRDIIQQEAKKVQERATKTTRLVRQSELFEVNEIMNGVLVTVGRGKNKRTLHISPEDIEDDTKLLDALDKLTGLVSEIRETQS